MRSQYAASVTGVEGSGRFGVKSHAALDEVHGGIRNGRNALGALAEHTRDVSGIGGDLAVALLKGLEVGDDHLGYLFFQVAVAHAAEVRAHLVSCPAAESVENVEQVFDAGAEGCEIHRRIGIGGGAHD